jgi:serine/threonine protein kinase
MKLIGKGSFSSVYLVKKVDSGKFYAMKELSKVMLINDRKKGRVITEKMIFMNINNPFVVKMHYAFQTPDKVYFILDFVNGGELHTHMIQQNRFSEAKTKFYAAEMLVALSSLHKAGIIYRDLKPNNILLDSEGHIKLIDFGLSKFENKGQNPTKSVVGTPNYIAPEVLKKDNHTEMIDWWSYGVIIYEMISGNLPFFDDNVQ